MIVAKKLEDYGVIIKDEIKFSLENKEKYIEEFKELKFKGVISQSDTFEGIMGDYNSKNYWEIKFPNEWVLF